MVGAKWNGTFVTAVAWAGLAWGQQTLPSSPASPAEPARFMTVQELGKAPQRCRVVRSWKESDGMTAHEVQSISTGERMTIVEGGVISDQPGSAPGSKIRGVTTRIYHWVRGNTPPEGAPVPVGSSVVSQPQAGSSPYSMPRGAYQGSGADPSAGNSYVTGRPRSEGDTDDGVEEEDGFGPRKPKIKTAVAPAQPSDWRSSWGKADNHRTKAPLRQDLPRAAAGSQDPLKDPAPYCPVEESRTVPKTDDKSPPAKVEEIDSPSQKTEKPAPEAAQSGPKSDVQQVGARTPSSLPVSAPAPETEAAEAAGEGHPETRFGALKRLFQRDDPMEETRSRPPQVVDERSAETEERPPAEQQRLPHGIRSIVSADNVPLTVRRSPATRYNPYTWGPRDQKMAEAMKADPMPVDPEIENAFTVPVAPPSPESQQLPPDQANAFCAPPPSEQPDPSGLGSPRGFAPAPGSYPGYPPVAAPNGYVRQGPAYPPGMPMPNPYAAPMVQQAAFVNPALASVPVPVAAPTIPGLLEALQSADLPSLRESAAEQLARAAGPNQAEVVAALVRSARLDPAPSVRAGCVHCLATMRVTTPEVLNALRELKSDPDPRVRQEVELLLGDK